MTTLRDRLLDECCKKKLGVTIIVQNGFQTRGVVVAFDETTMLLLRDDGRQIMFYHSAVSSILPHTPISITERNTKQ